MSFNMDFIMTKQELTHIIESIYDWPLDSDKAWLVYENFIRLITNGNMDDIDYLFYICSMDKEQRQKYRAYLASKGFELRPDELNQFVLIIMIATTS